MIIDSIANASSYVNLSSRIATALGFISRHDLAKLSPGRHEIEGDRIFANIQDYLTKPAEQCFWEAHRRYMDVQFVESGIEAMGWAPIQQMQVVRAYDSDTDVVVMNGPGEQIEISSGRFVILMPHDVHMPGLMLQKPQRVRKVVVKVAVD
ncbi:MAG TPA: YhcH/YjgK/YiaL family protein [Tepidisphaeraceae bacterium]|nr:YhcH/YjgK/YiaL family protein [Tepidisphaeraceae bacterium]